MKIKGKKIQTGIKHIPKTVARTDIGNGLDDVSWTYSLREINKRRENQEEISAAEYWANLGAFGIKRRYE